MLSEQRMAERRIRFKAMAGVIDFVGVVACAILIISLIALLANLYTWLVSDLTQSFYELQQSVTEAIIVH